MPIHDWTLVDPGLFHHFHQEWTIELGRALNRGALPDGYFALAEQVVGGPIPDVVTLQRFTPTPPHPSHAGCMTVAEAPPRARYIATAEVDSYAERANRLVIRHRHGEVVAVIEIVSPGNKNSLHGLPAFVEKSAELLRSGIHLLVVDLFPPSSRDPQGIHKAIWDEICDEPFELPPDKPMTVASYVAGLVKSAYIDPVAVGDALPSAPIFLDEGSYVPVPLEATYQAAWDNCPQAICALVEKSE